MPKMFALERAEGLALITARPLELFAKVFQWPLWVFNWTGTNLGRLLGLKSSLQHNAVYSEVELRQLIDISRESGHLRAEERRLIHRVFEFSDTLVREADGAAAGQSQLCPPAAHFTTLTKPFKGIDIRAYRFIVTRWIT